MVVVVVEYLLKLHAGQLSTLGLLIEIPNEAAGGLSEWLCDINLLIWEEFLQSFEARISRTALLMVSIVEIILIFSKVTLIAGVVRPIAVHFDDERVDVLDFKSVRHL